MRIHPRRPQLTQHAPQRLSDVIAAIQAMAIYKFYKLSYRDWADRISGDPDRADHWKDVFEEHPEFFRLDSSRQKASLVWRRQQPKLYQVDKGRTITKEEFLSLTDPSKSRVSRSPLGSSEVAVLVNIAVDLHTKASDRQSARRWVPTIAIGAISAALTALAAYLGAVSGQ